MTRASLFLIVFAAIAIAAISHPALGAGAIYPGEMEPAPEAPTAEPPVEPPAPEPLVESPTAEPPTVEDPTAESPPAEPPTAEPPPAEPPTVEPPLEIQTTELPPAEAPPAEPVATGEVPPPVVEGLEAPAGGASVATLPAILEAPMPEEPEPAPVAEPGRSVVIQTSNEGESLQPITGELRAVLLVDASTPLTRLADVSSAGTTRRTASGRPARGPVERTASEAGWPPQIPAPSAPPVPSHLVLTFGGQAASGGSFRADLALGLSALALVFTLIAQVARPINSRLDEAALVTRVPQPG